MRYPRTVRLALLALTTLLLLAGCGQKGPLYLPDEPPEEDEVHGDGA